MHLAEAVRHFGQDELQKGMLYVCGTEEDMGLFLWGEIGGQSSFLK